MTSILHQTLRGLCYDTGWCYAVFWKLKRQIRTVLTWEDGFYEPSKSLAMPTVSAAMNSSVSRVFDHQTSEGPGNFEDQIGQAVAKMSYHVYSVGEGIIGRVAFTNKHQWIFSGNDGLVTAAGITGSKQFPAGWQNQFAAGIKTIAVIAVPQGVVQLGSTHMIAEDLNLVGHIKAVLGTLQNVPGAFLSDLVSEAHRGQIHEVYPISMPVARVTSMHPPSTNSVVPALMRTAAVPGIPGNVTGLGAIGNNRFGESSVGRLSTLVASQQSHPQSQSTTPAILGTQRSALWSQHSFLHGLASGSCAYPSLATITSTTTRAMPTTATPAKAEVPPRTGIIGHFGLTTKFSDIDFTAAGKSTTSCSDLSKLGSSSKVCVPSILVPNVENSELVNNILPITATPAKFLDRTKNALNQGQQQSQSGSSFHSTKFHPSSGDSLILDSSASSASQESLQTSAINSLRNNVLIRQSRDESEDQSQVCESHGLNGDVGIAAAHKSDRPLSRLLPQLETKNCSDNTRNASNSYVDLPVSYSIPSTEHCENAVKLNNGGHSSFEKVALDQNVTFSISCEDSIEDLQPLKTFQKSGSCLRDLSGNATSQNAFNNELDDFDDFIASLTKEQNNPKDSLCLLGTGFAAVDELSDALFCVSKTLPQKSCFQDSEQKKGNIEGFGASIGQERDKATMTAESNVMLKHVLQEGILDAKPEPLLEAVVAGVSYMQPMHQNGDTNDFSTSELPSVSCFPPDLMSKPCGSRDFVNKQITLKSSDSLPPNVNEVAQLLCKDRNLNDLQWARGGQTHMVELASCAGLCDPKDDARKGCQKVALLPVVMQDDTVKAGKKRARPGETGKPRPKDRQQIQDRVRELREIIPNATKCSIDALLERTIKYMNFLQTVTQDADKWKQSSKLQTAGSNHIRPGPDGLESGASWAVELGGQGIGCPIIVENLTQPRQMLVEMLCEETGIFFEIAESIRGLGLTILKGVMEDRNSKIWARFMVEDSSGGKAVQDVRRVEVLWSLIQLLQPNTRALSNITSSPCAWNAKS